MSAQHTPGPWQVRSLAPNIALQIVGSHIVIAALPTLNNEPWAPANARLIAAAPKLLAALQVILALDDGDNAELWDFAAEFEAGRAAVAEALGETA